MSIFKSTNALFEQAGGEGGGSGGAGGAATGGQGAAGGQSGSGPGHSGDGKSGDGASGGGGGAGAAGAKDTLFGDAGGKAGSGGGSGDGKGGQGGGTGDANSNGATGGGSGGIVIPTNWKDALPQELRDEAFMKLVPDVPTLAKNYANVQKLIGADKLPIPGKHATENDWKEAFHKLGNPRDLAEYNIEVDKETEPLVDKEFVEGFKKQAHSLGVLPRQAQAMVKWFGELNKNSWQAVERDSEAKSVADMQALDREWGTAKEAKTVAAKAAIHEFADQETAGLLRDLGLGKNAKFIKFMSKIGETLSEDKLRAADQGGGNFSGHLTPAQASAKIAEIKGNMRHPYWVSTHENHKAAVKEMTGLFEMANPSKKSS